MTPAFTPLICPYLGGFFSGTSPVSRESLADLLTRPFVSGIRIKHHVLLEFRKQNNEGLEDSSESRYFVCTALITLT